MLLGSALIVMAHVGSPQLPDASEFAKPLVQLLEAQWPKNRTVTIVCHGHSVPAGYFKTPVVQPFDSYPHLLHKAIQSWFPHAVVNVIVTAIGGEESESGAKRFERDVMALHPDVVTIDYGLNDRGIGLERAKTAWASMIQRALKDGVKVILLTPSWDQRGDVSDPNDPLQQHAKQIRELATSYKTGLADSLAAFMKVRNNVAEFMSQSNHPNRAGHELIVKELAPWFGVF